MTWLLNYCTSILANDGANINNTSVSITCNLHSENNLRIIYKKALTFYYALPISGNLLSATKQPYACKNNNPAHNICPHFKVGTVCRTSQQRQKVAAI